MAKIFKGKPLQKGENKFLHTYTEELVGDIDEAFDEVGIQLEDVLGILGVLQAFRSEIISRGTTTAPGNDLNNIEDTGLRHCNLTTENSPDSSNFYTILTFIGPSNLRIQLAFRLLSTGDRIYFRNRYTGNWQNWKYVELK